MGLPRTLSHCNRQSQSRSACQVWYCWRLLSETPLPDTPIFLYAFGNTCKSTSRHEHVSTEAKLTS